MNRSSIAVAAGGFACFVNLYALQSMLPTLQQEFGVSQGLVSLTVTSSTLAMALGSPLAGWFVARFPRRRLLAFGLGGLVLTTLAGAAATSLSQLVLWRFLQGLCLPPLLGSLMSFIGERWAGAGVGAAMSNYVTWTVIGGFLGRYAAGWSTAEWGWRPALLVTALLTAGAGAVLLQYIPEGRTPTRAPATPPASWWRRPQFVAAFGTGFAALFTLVATFTYITFHLSAAPFSLGPEAVGRLFCVYLLGVVITPLAGRLIVRYGYRLSLLGTAALTGVGILLTLYPTLWPVVLGLALISTAAFISQAATSGFVSELAGAHRAGALGYYMLFYYLGGSFGAALPGLVWHLGGWHACALLLAVVQAGSAYLVATRFRREVALVC